METIVETSSPPPSPKSDSVEESPKQVKKQRSKSEIVESVQEVSPKAPVGSKRKRKDTPATVEVPPPEIARSRSEVTTGVKAQKTVQRAPVEEAVAKKKGLNAWMQYLTEYRSKNRDTFKGKSSRELIAAAAAAYKSK